MTPIRGEVGSIWGFASFRLSLLPILTGDIRFKDLIVKNADARGQTNIFSNKPVPFKLNGFSIEAKGIRKKSFGSFKARGKLFSEEDNFEVYRYLIKKDFLKLLELEDLEEIYDLIPTKDLVAFKIIDSLILKATLRKRRNKY